jgi:predicted transcriptional regulator
MVRDLDKSGPLFQILVSLPVEVVRQLDEIAKQTKSPRVALIRSSVEAFLAEHGGEKLSADLPDDLLLALAALHDAMDGAQKHIMIEKALREYVEKTLKENRGIRKRFVEASKRLTASVSDESGRVVEFRRTRMS